MELTEYGRRFLRHIEQALEALANAKHEIDEELNPHRGEIHISLVPNLSYNFIPQVIKAFYSDEANKPVRFRFSETLATQKALESMRSYNVDLCFAAKIDSPDMGYFEIGKEELILIVSPHHPLAVKEQVWLADLAAETLITYNYSCGTRYYIDVVFEQAGLALKEIVELETEKMMASAVASGLGVCILSRSDLTGYDVVACRLENGLQRPLYMMWYEQGFIRPAVKNFRDFVIAAVRRGD